MEQGFIALVRKLLRVYLELWIAFWYLRPLYAHIYMQ